MLSVIKKIHLLTLTVLGALSLAGLLLVRSSAEREAAEQLHYEREETELIVSPLPHSSLQLFKAGKNLGDTARVASFNGERMWLGRGNYFLQVEHERQKYFLPIPLTSYRSGPEEDGAFVVTVRPAPLEKPPRLLASLPEFVSIASGNFLFGDRLNPREPHYVWLTGYFIAPFEVSNAEFREFLHDPAGYVDDWNWSESGRKWKAENLSQATARLQPGDAEYERFGQSDQPVVWVNWFEAFAFCKWLTQKIGAGKWQFSLPTEAEWEKAARGPDNFDYGLSMFISDAEIPLYNWKKNPDAPVTVVGANASPALYQPNRFGLYHMSGNVVEWTQSLHLPFSKRHPYSDHDRMRHEAGQPGLRVARGGSWYSASVALLSVAYRDAFQPEHSSQDIGFRLIAKRLP